MQLIPKKITALYSDSSFQEVQMAYVETDGLDILSVKKTLSRPYTYDLKDKLLNVTPDQLADKKFLDLLNHEVSDFFIDILKESEEERPDFITITGPVLQTPNADTHVIELGDLQHIAQVFQLPVVGHFIQSDLNAGGVGSPLKAVFWEALSRKLEKPCVIFNVGGILKLTYLGPNGEIRGFDVGIGTALMDAWVFKKTGQSQDDNGWLSAQGKANTKVVKVLLQHPYFLQSPPKAVNKADFSFLSEQLEGLTPADGCATLVRFYVESFKKACSFLPESPKTGVMIGGGLKNPALTLALKQSFPKIQKAEEAFAPYQHLNAIGTAFLGARFFAGLPISLPTTTGVADAVSVGEVFDPEPDK